MVERIYCYSLKTRKRKEVAEFSIHTNGYSNLQELFALGDYLYLSIFSSDEARIYLRYQISTGEWREFPEEYKFFHYVSTNADTNSPAKTLYILPPSEKAGSVEALEAFAQENGWSAVTLGQRIYRMETAAIASVILTLYELER